MKTLSTALGILLILGFAEKGLAAQKKVEGPIVAAGDIISRCQNFCDVEVAKSPVPGQHLVIYGRDVADALLAAGFTANPKAIPKSTRIVRSSRTANAKELGEAARQAIASVLPAGVQLEAMGDIPAGDVPVTQWEATASYEDSGMFQHTRSVEVVFLSDGVPFRKTFVMCRLTYLVQVPVAAMEIGRNEQISAGAVVIREMQMDARFRNAVLDINEIVGAKSRGVVPEGGIFEKRNLIETPLVLRGDAITVISRMNGIRISARGVARQDAVRGAKIAVEIPSMNKLLFAKIVEPGLGVVQQ